MPKYVAAIDQGTTSTRFMIFDHSGREVGKDQLEHEQILPQAGWVEHDPLEIMRHTRAVMQGAVDKSGVNAGDIASIGITNQRETTVVWNKETGRPYFNAIVWQDTRTNKIVDRLSAEGGADRFREKTGLPISTYFSGTKLVWLLENVAGLREDAEKGVALFGTIDTWLIWNLTGGINSGQHITDPSNASRTMLMNLRTLDWDDELLEAFDVPRSMLAEIRPSSDPGTYGSVDLGNARIPLAGALGDQQAALYGQTCFSPGEGKNTYGTGNFFLVNTGTELVHSKNGLLTTVAYQFGSDAPVYALEGSIAVTGSLIQWLRDNLKLIDDASEIEALAQTVQDNGDVYFVPAFSGLFAPYWRQDARGAIVGLTRFNNQGHIARAALEATAYQTRDIADAMAVDSGVELTTLKVDGGMTVNNLLMQFQSDILGVEVIRPEVPETTALGAAYASGQAVGFWNNQDELRANWQVAARWQPAMAKAERERLYTRWKKAVERTLDWVD